MTLRKATIVAGISLCLASGEAAAQFGGANVWYTVPMAASKNDTQQVLGLLIQPGADPDGIDSTSGRTALDFAASFDNTQMAQVLLDHGAHLDARDTIGDTALHYAAERGSIAMMRFLIAHKATIEAGNKQGITPLMVAADHGQPNAVRLLVESGADPRKQDYTGRDAVGWAGNKQNVLKALAAKH